MKILSIETSCDDTCIAVLKIQNLRFKILSNVVSSQVKIHKKWGGVYPTLAKREHQKNLVPVLEEALKKANMLINLKFQIPNPKQTINSKFQTLEKILERDYDLLKNLKKFLKQYQKPKVDAIAVTMGPGLEPCLWVGVNFAKSLGYFWNLPIIPVNHIEAHILSNWINPTSLKLKSIKFPAISLVVSGGHTQLILMIKIGNYKILGETRDDAAGECFDKAAKILGLEYPGGPAIAKQASQWNFQFSIYNFQIKLPRPMIYQKNYDFSFSGLKTAVLYNYKNKNLKTRTSKKYIQKMSREIQQSIIDVLIKKTIKAGKNYKVKTIILGGGVAANKELRRQLKNKVKKEMPSTECLLPDIKYCTDNAAMIAITAHHHWPKGKTKIWRNIKANANLRIGKMTNN